MYRYISYYLILHCTMLQYTNGNIQAHGIELHVLRFLNPEEKEPPKIKSLSSKAPIFPMPILVSIQNEDDGPIEGCDDGCSVEQASQNRPRMSEGTPPLPPLLLCCGRKRQIEVIPWYCEHMCIETYTDQHN